MVLSYLPGASLVPRWLSDGSFPASLVPRKLSNESFPASLALLRLSTWSFPLWCLLVRGNPVLACATGSQPWSPPQDLPRTGPIATEIVLKLCKIRRPSKIGIRSAIVRRVSLVPPWYLPGGANGSFLPPGASQAVQLILSCLRWILSCLPGASQAVQMVLSYLPGASLAVRWILSCLPGASQAVQRVLSFLPGASQAVQMDLSCLPGASLSKAPSGTLKASLCYGRPTVEPAPGFTANRADRH